MSLLADMEALNKKISEVTDLLNATIRVVGNELVYKEYFDGMREQQKKFVAGLLGKQLRVTDVVTDDSFVVGSEIDAEGRTLAPGRFQISFRELNDESKQLLRGLKVGESAKTAVGGTLLVTEIYQIGNWAEESSQESQPTEAPAVAVKKPRKKKA